MAQGLFTLKQVNQAVRQNAWSSTQKTPAVDYLVVAGAGAGGDNPDTSNGNGGGGAGGLLAGNMPVVAGTSYTVTIGAGSGRFGTAGTASVLGPISANGGGTGARFNNNVSYAGGSGGGGSSGYSFVLGSQGIAGQGNKGGNGVTGGVNGGGGGGASTVGANAGSTVGGVGGAGIASAITGTLTTYAGGGGGTGQNGGTGGGGTGNGTNGTANTGGGGGAGQNYGDAGTGGSGIVILSYPDTYAAATSTTGSPTVSTSGSGSLLFNGSSQWLTFATNAAWSLGSTFTVEAWVYPTAFSANNKRICQSDSGLDMNVNSSGALQFGPATTTSTLTLNTWTHVAAVVNSGTLTIFFNGVSQTLTGTTTGFNYTASGSLSVGVYQVNNGYVWQGYISNFRVVKGSAVYTGNFTPSTTPLTAITNTQLLLNTVSGAPCADTSVNSFAPNSSVSIVPTWNAASPFTVTGYKNRVYTWTSSGSITF